MSQEILLLGSEVSIPSALLPGKQGQQKGTREKSLCVPPLEASGTGMQPRESLFTELIWTHVNSSRIIRGLGG